MSEMERYERKAQRSALTPDTVLEERIQNFIRLAVGVAVFCLGVLVGGSM